MITGVSLVYALAEAAMLAIVYGVWRREERPKITVPRSAQP